eukprot:g4350.t1
MTDSSTSTILDDSLLTSASAASLTAAYNSPSLPFPCVTIPRLCDPSRLARVREELKHHVNFNFKETDLFKLYQSKDLASISPSTHPELSSNIPNLLALRDALYSKEFRAFVKRVTGLSFDLTDRVDLAASAYSKGSHLLAHDDVIGTRAVSFIVYLSDEGWSAEDGGALELYGRDPATGDPLSEPAKKILPSFNTMGLFGVLPGKSFHAVEEVHTDESPRLSLQGWYHGEKPPQGARESASLVALKRGWGTVASSSSLPAPRVFTSPVSDDFTAADAKVLAPFVNEVYLKPENQRAIRKEFERNAVVKLGDFLTERATRGADDVSGGGVWTTVGPLHMQRYQRLVVKDGARYDDEDVHALARARRLFARSPELARLLRALTGEDLTGVVSSECRRFRRGRDYTVAHHGLLEKENRLDAVVTFVKTSAKKQKKEIKNSGDDDDDDAWESGDVGGFECYIAADEDDALEAAEVYATKDDEENQLLNVTPERNTLSLVLRDTGVMRFVKYVSASAPSDRFDVSTVFSVAQGSGEGEEEEEEEEAAAAALSEPDKKKPRSESPEM